MEVRLGLGSSTSCVWAFSSQYFEYLLLLVSVGVANCHALVTLTVKYLGFRLNDCADFKRARDLCSSKTILDYLWLLLCDNLF
jgi:hypothetical protein